MTSRSKSQSRGRSRSSRRSQQRTQRRSQSGGAWGAYPDSAWGFQMNNLGNGWTQFMNTFSVQGGQNGSMNQSNDIVQNTPKMIRGGKARNMMKMRQRQMLQAKSQSRGKKGGFFGPVLEKAVVPLALLGAQQYYGKRHSRQNYGRNKTFKRRR